MKTQLHRFAPLSEKIEEVPKGGKAYWLTASDGTRLRGAFWEPAKTSKGTVFLLPGRTEYVELYSRNVRALLDQDYSIAVIDWRGHGLSDRIPGDETMIHVPDFECYQQDMDALLEFAEQKGQAKPWFLFGSSLGGCIGLRSLCRGAPFKACAFVAPMWGIQMTAFRRALSWPVAALATKLGRSTSYCPGHDARNYISGAKFNDNRITSDKDMFDYWLEQTKRAPELQAGGSSLGWLLAALRECRAFGMESFPDVPSLVFQAGRDAVVDNDAIASICRSWKSCKSLTFPEARHGLLLEKLEVRRSVFSEVSTHFQ